MHYLVAGLIIAGLAFWLGGRMSEPTVAPRVTSQGSHLVEKEATPPPEQSPEDEQDPGLGDDLQVISMDSLPKVGAAPAETALPNTAPPGAGNLRPGTERPPTPDPAVSEGLNLAQASTRLRGAAEMAKMCRRPGAQTGAGKVQVTFDPSGSVSAVEVMPPYAGTGAGSCVAQKFRMVKVPPFKGSPTTLQKGFHLAE
jgi:hypothetical protein